MAEDIRSAAERLRRHDYGYCPNRHQKWQDTETLAAAFLSEHLPDDNEPLTVEWLGTV